MPKAEKTKFVDKKPLHPLSRKAAQLAKKNAHNDRVIERRHEFNLKLRLQGEKILWFRDHLGDGVTGFTKLEVLELVERYLDRFNEELEQINIKSSIAGRQGRQHAGREDAIKMMLERDTRDFESSGLEIPDLFNTRNVVYLRNWNGELRYLNNIKLKTVSRKQLFS